VGEYPPIWAHRPPGPAFSPKWVNQLFVVRPYCIILCHSCESPSVSCSTLHGCWTSGISYSETTNGCPCHCRLCMTACLYR